jgi:putative ABC transport system permease protein
MRFWVKFTALFHRRKLDADMAEEMQLHLERRAEENVADGMSREEARYAALRKFGGAEQAKELAREQRGWNWPGELGRDLRFALRQLAKSPGFTVIALLTLALGIGGVTTQFSVIDAALIRGLPFPESGRLMRVSLRDPSWAAGRVRGFWLEDKPVWSRDHSSVEGLAGFLSGNSFIVTIDNTPQRLKGAEVTDDFFTLLRVKPALGRLFTPEDNRPDAPHVTIVSDALWKSDFAGDPNIIGSAIRLNGHAATVVGVMPPGFNFPNDQLWQPMFNDHPLTNGAPRALPGGSFTVIARLRPGATPDQATGEFTTLAQRAAQDFPSTNGRYTEAVVEPLLNVFVGRDARQLMWVMLAAVATVLLIACVNVMNMQFARTTHRAKELAVRSALGASRRRLVAQLLTESLVVAAAGTAAGVLLARWMIDAFAGRGAGLPAWMHFEINGVVLAVTVAVSAGTLVFAGLIPAWIAARTDPIDALKQGGRGQTHPLVNRVADILVIGQIALTTTLLVTSLLLIKSVTTRASLDFGYDLGSVLTGTLNFEAESQDNEFVGAEQARLLQQLRASPQFTHAAFTSRNNGLMTTFSLGLELEHLPGRTISAFCEVVSDDYFATIGLKPLEGREFALTDMPGRPPPALVNATFARKYFPNESPLGRRLRPDPKSPWCTIVGVVPDTLMQGPMDAGSDGAGFFLPRSYRPLLYIALVVRGHSSDPRQLVEPLRREILRFNPNLALYEITTPQSALGTALTRVRTVTQLFGYFGLVALILSAVGLYGVASFSVGQRTQEFGIRAALGAAPRQIMKMVLRQGARCLVLGGGLGLTLAFALARVGALAGSNLLYKVSPRDPAIYAGVLALLGVTTLIACFVPARRATKVDPVIALRAD